MRSVMWSGPGVQSTKITRDEGGTSKTKGSHGPKRAYLGLCPSPQRQENRRGRRKRSLAGGGQ